MMLNDLLGGVLSAYKFQCRHKIPVGEAKQVQVVQCLFAIIGSTHAFLQQYNVDDEAFLLLLLLQNETEPVFIRIVSPARRTLPEQVHQVGVRPEFDYPFLL
jgi:hypothetical protein